MGIVLLKNGEINFPEDIDTEHDIVAISQQVSPVQILPAYKRGIFPWPNEENLVLWTSPSERAIIYPQQFKISRSLKKKIRLNQFEYKIDQNFEAVIKNCRNVDRKDQPGTWITKNMTDTFCVLHEQGIAHSFETYFDGNLVGGLYGICIGKIFIGESMFSLVSEASKFSMAVLVSFCIKNKFILIDCQIQNPYLSSLGAVCIKKEAYLKILDANSKSKLNNRKWDTLSTQDISPVRLLPNHDKN